MFASLPARWLALFPAVGALSAIAQPTSPPAESTATHPVVSYQSALEGYRPFADEKPIPWKAANDTVHRRGGWRAYAKEAENSGAGDGPAIPKPTTPAKERP